MPLKDNLWRDTVGLLDRKDAQTIPPTASIRDAVEKMRQQRTGCLFVEDADALVGIFTERDFLKRVTGRCGSLDQPISAVMTRDPETIQIDDIIGVAMQKMTRGGYRQMPIVDARGKIVGRVSVRDIVHYMVEYFADAVYNLPPRPDTPNRLREGA